MVAIFNTPVLAYCLDGAVFFLWAKTGEEEAGTALRRLGLLFLAPVTLHAERRTSAWQSGRDRRDSFHGGFTGVDAPVSAFSTQVKKGEPSRAWAAPLSRLEVFSLVPTR